MKALILLMYFFIISTNASSYFEERYHQVPIAPLQATGKLIGSNGQQSLNSKRNSNLQINANSEQRLDHNPDKTRLLDKLRNLSSVGYPSDGRNVRELSQNRRNIFSSHLNKPSKGFERRQRGSIIPSKLNKPSNGRGRSQKRYRPSSNLNKSQNGRIPTDIKRTVNNTNGHPIPGSPKKLANTNAPRMAESKRELTNTPPTVSGFKKIYQAVTKFDRKSIGQFFLLVIPIASVLVLIMSIAKTCYNGCRRTNRQGGETALEEGGDSEEEGDVDDDEEEEEEEDEDEAIATERALVTETRNSSEESTSYKNKDQFSSLLYNEIGGEGDSVSKRMKIERWMSQGGVPRRKRLRKHYKDYTSLDIEPAAPFKAAGIVPSISVTAADTEPSTTVAEADMKPSTRVAKGDMKPSTRVTASDVTPSARVTAADRNPFTRVDIEHQYVDQKVKVNPYDKDELQQNVAPLPSNKTNQRKRDGNIGKTDLEPFNDKTQNDHTVKRAYNPVPRKPRHIFSMARHMLKESFVTVSAGDIDKYR